VDIARMNLRYPNDGLVDMVTAEAVSEKPLELSENTIENTSHPMASV
jgi:hypothetical protein